LHLLILGFFLALVNCTSSVTYLPFVNRFDPKWLNIYFAGEALSSLIPAMLGLAQVNFRIKFCFLIKFLIPKKGVGQKPVCIPVSLNSTERKAKYFPPRFSVQIYLICLSIIMLISFIAFILLWKTQLKKKEKLPAEQFIAGENAQDSALLTVNNDQLEVKIEDKNEEKFTFETIMYLLIILWTSILLIGCIPSINSYSLNPYGASTFHYVLIACKVYFNQIFFKEIYF